MYEIQEHLETILNGKILSIHLDHQNNIQPTVGLYGIGFTQMGPPITEVTVVLLQRSLIEQDCAKRPLHLDAFRGVTSQAHITSIQQDVTNHGFTLFICFRVYDLEAFTKDVTEYAWNNFNDKFTRQLDTVLEEE